MRRLRRGGQRSGAGFELQAREPRVEAVPRQERGVRSLLDDASGLDDEDAMRVDDRREPMRDDKRRPALHQRFERALHQGFAFGVEGRGRLVEEQHRRIFENCAGDGDALALPPDSVTPRSPKSVS